VKPAKPLSVERGQVWLVLLRPTVGREINKKDRPSIVVSNDTFNKGPSELAVVVPTTGTDGGNPLHVRVDPPEGGLRDTSYALCDQIRTVSSVRLGDYLGRVSQDTLREIADRVKILLDIP